MGSTILQLLKCHFRLNYEYRSTPSNRAPYYLYSSHRRHKPIFNDLATRTKGSPYARAKQAISQHSSYYLWQIASTEITKMGSTESTVHALCLWWHTVVGRSFSTQIFSLCPRNLVPIDRQMILIFGLSPMQRMRTNSYLHHVGTGCSYLAGRLAVQRIITAAVLHWRWIGLDCRTLRYRLVNPEKVLSLLLTVCYVFEIIVICKLQCN